MLKDRTLLCSICPTIYVNKHLSRLTYGRVRAKGSNYVETRNRRNIEMINKQKDLDIDNGIQVDVSD